MKNLENLLIQATDLKTKMKELATIAIMPRLTKRQRKIAGMIVENLMTKQDWTIDAFLSQPMSRTNSRAIARSEAEIVHRYKSMDKSIELNKFSKLKTKKGPKHDKARFFGIEIECIIPYESNEDNEGEHCGDEDCMDCDNGDYHNDGETGTERVKKAFQDARLFDMDIKGDGSIGDYESSEFGLEIAFTCSINNLEKIDRVCAVLNKLGARVNKSCGLHVHVDMRNRDAKTQGQRLVNVLPILRRLVPESRRTNTYCLDNKGKLKYSSRYYAINWNSFQKYKTVEVRLHSSTTNATKIKNWVTLLNASVECTALDSKKFKSIEKLITDDALAMLGLNSEIRRFFLKREVVFSNTAINTEQRENNTEAA